MVGEGGLEPPRACAHKILSLACIPISPLAHCAYESGGYQRCIVLYLTVES
jgi:hypothetical protein